MLKWKAYLGITTWLVWTTRRMGLTSAHFRRRFWGKTSGFRFGYAKLEMQEIQVKKLSRQLNVWIWARGMSWRDILGNIGHKHRLHFEYSYKRTDFKNRREWISQGYSEGVNCKVGRKPRGMECPGSQVKKVIQKQGSYQPCAMLIG